MTKDDMRKLAMANKEQRRKDALDAAMKIPGFKEFVSRRSSH